MMNYYIRDFGLQLLEPELEIKMSSDQIIFKMEFSYQRPRGDAYKNGKTQSAPICDHKYQDSFRKRNKIHAFCSTPSTDDNHSQTTKVSKSLSYLYENNQIYNKIISWKSDLLELLNLIYIEDYTFIDLQEYFTYSVYLVRNLSSFHQILYNSIRNYLSQIRNTIHHSLNEVLDYRMIQKHIDPDTIQKKNIYRSFGQHAPKYCQIVSLLMKSYEMVEEKSLEIQKIVNFFVQYMTSLNDEEQIIQQLNCAELHRTLFVEMILKDEAIKTFLDNLSFINTDSKFYQSSFQIAFNKLQKINQLRTSKSRPRFSSTIEKKQQPVEVQTHATFKQRSNYKSNSLYTQAQQSEPLKDVIITNIDLNTTSKKKKKNKKNKSKGEVVPNQHKGQIQYISKDDVKELERKMDLEFEQTKKNEKIKVEFPQDWINKLRHKLVQTLKNLH